MELLCFPGYDPCIQEVYMLLNFSFFFFPANLFSAKNLEEETFFFPPLQQQNRKIEVGDKRMEEYYFLNRYEEKTNNN